ncbi:RHS repeat-associated core domain-containing protein [Apibacter adventoris]|uniref:RHS repeat-associated core domain-containing protein n=1 Tax=Apibacter adventoris TaxID=1679466 RepID=UPI0021A58DBD|nr:RHS repeat-associated core domain-containing protein [Apibacter adventoris]
MWNTPYLFNGKELDEETGLYYYGTRYYNPRESVWLSTDPLSDYNLIFGVEHYIDGQHNGGYLTQETLIRMDTPIETQSDIYPNGKQIEWFNKWAEEKKINLVNDLVKRHKSNSTKIMAYSIAADVIIETTDKGEWVTKAREKIINTYGDTDTKKANEVYSQVISTLKDIKEAIEGNINSEDKSKRMLQDKSGKKQTKLDNYLYVAAAKLALKAVGLQIENKAIEETVKKLDEKTYDSKLSTKPKDSGFGGGGASGKY